MQCSKKNVAVRFVFAVLQKIVRICKQQQQLGLFGLICVFSCFKLFGSRKND